MANNVNRTNKNTPNNRGKLTEKEKFLLLRSVWQGWSDSNRQDSFWRAAVYH